MKRGIKIHNRIRKVREDTFYNLLYKLPIKCQSCRYNFACPQLENMDDTKICNNYIESIKLNTLIEMLNFQNINLQHFADKNNLKIEFLRLMLKGKMLIKYRYFVCLAKRCRVPEFDEFNEYEERFENKENSNNELENNISESEVNV